MREILFKAKRKDNGEWVYGYYWQTINNIHSQPRFYIREESYSWDIKEYEVDYKTIGQFTGLTDKNGKKIFEGDIVKVFYTEKRDYHGVKYDDEFEMIEMVVHNENSACFMLEIDNEGITMFRPLHDFGNNVFIKSIEVIGNIHDNPELLGEQQ